MGTSLQWDLNNLKASVAQVETACVKITVHNGGQENKRLWGIVAYSRKHTDFGAKLE